MNKENQEIVKNDEYYTKRRLLGYRKTAAKKTPAQIAKSWARIIRKAENEMKKPHCDSSYGVMWGSIEDRRRKS